MTITERDRERGACGHEGIGHNDGPCCAVCELSEKLDAERAVKAELTAALKMACDALVVGGRVASTDEEDGWCPWCGSLAPNPHLSMCERTLAIIAARAALAKVTP